MPIKSTGPRGGFPIAHPWQPFFAGSMEVSTGAARKRRGARYTAREIHCGAVSWDTGLRRGEIYPLTTGNSLIFGALLSFDQRAEGVWMVLKQLRGYQPTRTHFLPMVFDLATILAKVWLRQVTYIRGRVKMGHT